LNQAFLEAGPDPQLGIEGAVGVLKHDLHSPTIAPQGFPGQSCQRGTGKTYFPGSGRVQLENCSGDRGFPAPRFSDKSENRIFINIETDPVHGSEGTALTGHQAAAVKLLYQIPYL
jgi:hypothetical protein